MYNHKLILTSKNLKPNHNASLHQREVLKRTDEHDNSKSLYFLQMKTKVLTLVLEEMVQFYLIFCNIHVGLWKAQKYGEFYSSQTPIEIISLHLPTRNVYALGPGCAFCCRGSREQQRHHDEALQSPQRSKAPGSC